jgi:cytoskeleton protein RodZ
MRVRVATVRRVEDRNHIAATLRQAREQRDLSVEAAAAEAGIPARYAHLLEGKTPSGVGISDELYLIPFFRRYATALGLAAEDLLPDFLGQVQELPPPSAPPLQMRTRGRRRAPWRALAVLAAVAIASLVIMRQAPERAATDEETWSDTEQAGTDPGEKPAEAAPKAAPAMAEAPKADGGGDHSAAPAEQAPAGVAEHAPQAVAEHAPAAAEAAPAPLVASADQPAAAAPVAPVPAPADGSHELRVSAAQETWFSLGIDDEPKRNIILQPGETRSWTAARAFTLTVGNAGGITVSIDGRELPPLGRVGQVVRNLRLPPERRAENG